MVKMTER
jgi:hypothetical protein